MTEHIPPKEAGAGHAMPTTGNTVISLFGATSCWGARDRRCDVGPQTLQNEGLQARLAHAGCTAVWEAMVAPQDKPAELSDDLYAVVAQFCSDLAACVKTAVDRRQPFVVLGGDHSCAIGTWGGARAALTGALGLIWIDAHMDAHTPQTSLSGHLHGMPVAALLGYGDARLCAVAGVAPKILPAHLCLIGVRSFETAEARLLATLGARVYHIDEVMHRGMTTVLQEAQAHVAAHTVAYGISLDLDAIDPQDVPGVGSPEPGGIAATALVEALRAVDTTHLLGVEIAEFNPARDVGNHTQIVIEDVILALYGRGGAA